MEKQFVVAIDGIAGAGKSTVATLVAKKLKVSKLNTGDIYRASTLKYIESSFQITNDNDAKNFVKTLNIKVTYDKSGNQHTFLDDIDVTEKLHAYNVSNLVSTISGYKPLRDYIKKIQREIAQNNSIVVEGRDIGSHVLPNADYKVFLTASIDVRAKRQYEELVNAGDKQITLESLKESIKQRDYNDTHRKYGAIKIAKDAKVIDTSNLTINQVVKQIVDFVKGK